MSDVPTFLGHPIICNEFTTCTEHQLCRLYRHRNYCQGENTPKRNGKQSRAKSSAKWRNAQRTNQPREAA